MTTTTEIGTAAPARVLSARTRAAYASDWALFTDHCAVAGLPALPADPHTVVDFLDSCPAAPATRRRRVAAIDHHHTALGHELSSATLDGTDSPCYLALERHVSGLPQQLTVPNSVVRRCQTIRQFTVLDLAVTKPSTKTIARALKKTSAVDHRSVHVCHTTPTLADTTRTVPLLPPIDQWGALPLPLQRLSPHSLSRRVRDLLAGDLGAHRDLPVDPDPEPVVTAPAKPPVRTPTSGNTYKAADAAGAWDRRRRELEHLAGITDVLTDVERRADELNRRAAELLEGWL